MERAPAYVSYVSVDIGTHYFTMHAACNRSLGKLPAKRGNGHEQALTSASLSAGHGQSKGDASAIASLHVARPCKTRSRSSLKWAGVRKKL